MGVAAVLAPGRGPARLVLGPVDGSAAALALADVDVALEALRGPAASPRGGQRRGPWMAVPERRERRERHPRQDALAPRAAAGAEVVHYLVSGSWAAPHRPPALGTVPDPLGQGRSDDDDTDGPPLSSVCASLDCQSSTYTFYCPLSRAVMGSDETASPPRSRTPCALLRSSSPTSQRVGARSLWTRISSPTGPAGGRNP